MFVRPFGLRSSQCQDLSTDSTVICTSKEQTAGTAPQISITYEYAESSEPVEITHDGGDSVEAGDRLIETDGGTVPWEDSDGTVTEDDSTAVDASSGTTVRVVWVGEEETRVLAEPDDALNAG